ncbi:EamA family transporter [Luteolibacter yonseiensis]
MEAADTGTPKSLRTRGVLLAVGSAASNQVGAAMGSLAFPVLGPPGVVAVRQAIAAVLLWSIAKPRLGSFTRAQWIPVLSLALALGVMNLTLYFAIQRIGLGLAVALEFLGPLGVSLFGARSRAVVVAAALAGIGVLALTHPDASSDFAGIGLALLAACGWASYILLNRTIGRRLPGLEGTAVATGISASLFFPIGVFIFIKAQPGVAIVCYAVGAGVLASAIPFALDLVTLRRLPPSLFGVISSIQPVFAALVGVVILRQPLIPLEWLGILLIAAANIIVLSFGGSGRGKALFN